MPSFLKDLSLRRRSKASFKTENGSSSNSENGSVMDQQPGSSAQSSTNLSLKPSPPTTTSLSSQRSQSHNNLASLNGSVKGGPPVPPRPGMSGASSSRYSINGMPAQIGDRQAPATSPLAPRVLSISDGSWVHQKVLLIFGQCADPANPVDGEVTVCHHQDNFPPTQWPVNDSHFKALVYLQPGPNRIRLDFTSPKVHSPTTSIPAHSSWININFLPLISAPPLQLCILVAKDSPETYDAVPERVRTEGNGLATAVKKFRMAAYLWQAFTAEQMNRNGFGRRCYRYEEEWQPGTLTWKDQETGQMRNEAKIHIIRLQQTVAEVQDLDVAQQGGGSKKGDLFGMAMDAVKGYFAARAGQPQYVTCMFLDSKWDKQANLIRGHAALGGGTSEVRLAIFGSHCLQSYPAHIEEVVPAFTDCTRTDTDYVANDCNESGSNWEAANIGIGAHMHETGHLFGSPHQESGVMLRDYVTLNRTFTTREPYSTRTKQQGQRLCLPKDECAWHRLDALRFRFHPCFHLPGDPSIIGDTSIQVWSVENNQVLITSATGVAWIEIFTEGDELCRHWIEYLEPGASPTTTPRQITMTEATLKEHLPAEKRKKKLGVKIFSCAGTEYEVKDFSSLLSSENRLKLPDGRPGFKSSKLGHSSMNNSRPIQHILGPCEKKSLDRKLRLLLSVRVYHGSCLDGMEFVYEDGTSELFGNRGGKPGGSEFALDTRKGEMLMGFYVRAGAWIDAVQILTSTGRRSEIFGNATGGSGYWLVPPRGYSIAGVFGSCGGWVDGFGLVITR
ncbi:unnamed protein product [Zymoseptoria tritici ST99CH_3D1]|nr:unnamed protein product [Zymoseptoria tritici ST99CH_3D1]